MVVLDSIQACRSVEQGRMHILEVLCAIWDDESFGSGVRQSANVSSDVGRTTMRGGEMRKEDSGWWMCVVRGMRHAVFSFYAWNIKERVSM